jgi:uncharacterized protein YidB (DUF937 family)
VQRFEQSGLGDVIRSWIASGPHQPIGTDELHRAIGRDTVDRLSGQMDIGKSRPAQVLPTIVDRLAPNQRVPDQGEISRMQSNQT